MYIKKIVSYAGLNLENKVKINAITLQAKHCVSCKISVITIQAKHSVSCKSKERRSKQKLFGTLIFVSVLCSLYTMTLAAPEVLSTTPYGHTADWWSLGILMYVVLAGRVS